MTKTYEDTPKNITTTIYIFLCVFRSFEGKKNTGYNIEKSTSQELRKGEGTNVDLRDPQTLSLDLSHPYLD